MEGQNAYSTDSIIPTSAAHLDPTDAGSPLLKILKKNETGECSTRMRFDELQRLVPNP